MAKPKNESEDLLELSKFRFTPERLRQACQRVQEVGGRYRWRDEACPHLTVRAGSRGGVFYRWGRDPKTSRVVSEGIGDVLGPNSVSLEAARNRCNELRFDPEARVAVPKRRRSGNSPTLSETWDQYIDAISTGRFSMSRKRRPSGRARSKLKRRTSRLTLKPTRKRTCTGWQRTCRGCLRT